MVQCPRLRVLYLEVEVRHQPFLLSGSVPQWFAIPQSIACLLYGSCRPSIFVAADPPVCVFSCLHPYHRDCCGSYLCFMGQWAVLPDANSTRGGEEGERDRERERERRYNPSSRAVTSPDEVQDERRLELYLINMFCHFVYVLSIKLWYIQSFADINCEYIYYIILLHISIYCWLPCYTKRKGNAPPPRYMLL